MSRHIGYATPDATTPLAPLEFDRREVGPTDVRVRVDYCGICHSDVHQARDEWGGGFATNYPCMPGHELAGTVLEIGASVTEISIGDRVGVGCMIASDGTCQACQEGLEQYCESLPTLTYNAKDPHTGEVTFGGYSDEVVVTEHFVLRLPDSIPLEKAGPILCAGVTTYSPLKHWDVGPGMRVGIAGFGGLGHMATQIAAAMGAEVTVLTTNPAKADDARRLGATEVLVMREDRAVDDAAGSLDLVLSTIPQPFDLKPYLSLVRRDGVFVTVGMLEPAGEGAIDFGTVSLHRQTLAGSFIGSIAETREVLEFCAEHGIAPEVEVIPASRINEAFDLVDAGRALYRYVIDNATLRD